MSTGAHQLYHETVLDHSKRPRNFRALPGGARTAEGYNPLCGDRVTVYAEVTAGGVLEDIAFQGACCAVATASASMMTEALRGTSRTDAARRAEAFEALVRRGAESPAAPDLGELVALAAVREFPSRVKCALLPWQTLEAALAGG